jgi:hypothetical protein
LLAGQRSGWLSGSGVIAAMPTWCGQQLAQLSKPKLLIMDEFGYA